MCGCRSCRSSTVGTGTGGYNWFRWLLVIQAVGAWGVLGHDTCCDSDRRGGWGCVGWAVSDRGLMWACVKGYEREKPPHVRPSICFNAPISYTHDASESPQTPPSYRATPHLAGQHQSRASNPTAHPHPLALVHHPPFSSRSGTRQGLNLSARYQHYPHLGGP